MKRRSPRISPAGRERYATAAGFAALFRTEMADMFHVAYVLTGDPVLAEKCLIAALNDCIGKDCVFAEYALAYARYAVIRRATKAICDRFQPSARCDTGERYLSADAHKHDALLVLPVFERAAFVLCVMERLSDKQASLLLRATPEVVQRARIQALERHGPLPVHAHGEENGRLTPRWGEATPVLRAHAHSMSRPESQ